MEKTVLIGVITIDQGIEKAMDYLEELAFLTLTAGGTVTKIFTQKLNNPIPKTFIGEGKIIEIREYVKEHDIQTVIFDDELSATQERNISKILNCKILDRTNLILDIFAQRAKTSAFIVSKNREDWIYLMIFLNLIFQILLPLWTCRIKDLLYSFEGKNYSVI